MYMLPLRFMKVGPDVAICATRIVAIMSVNAHQAREQLRLEKKAGTLINASGRVKTKSAVYLDNGTVIASPLTVNVLMSAIERSNAKRLDVSRQSTSSRIKVYDTYDEPPDKQDIEYAEITSDTTDYNENEEIE